MGVKSGYLNLGSLKIDGEHSELLSACKQSLLAMPARRRKKAVIQRLEVSEVIEALGLSDALTSLFIANRRAMNSDTEKAVNAMRQLLVDIVSQELTACGRQSPLPAMSPAHSSAAKVDSQPMIEVSTVTDADLGTAPAHVGNTPADTPMQGKDTPQPGTRNEPVVPVRPGSGSDSPQTKSARKSAFSGLMKLG